ncbi:MAG: NADH:flavin oxidoreductase/NADH oxidase [Chloroflexi bacterium]|nr:NADH:flavin oxidoreductase/NADH oxidase [Chloroflexota bacterium]
MANLFDPLTLRGVQLRNRIMLSPMCQYSAGTDAMPTDWHLVHLGSRAAGGAGLVMVEATAVEARGRISEGDLGIYTDAHGEAFARIARFCQSQGASVGLQLAHAGRKAWSGPDWALPRGRGPEPAVAPSAIPFDQGWPVPVALSEPELDRIVAAFGAGAARACAAGFEVLELHAGHGYLLHQFLSPLSNQRQDAYGGSPKNRMRLLLRVVDAVRAVWPEARPLFVRLSCTDWLTGGLEPEAVVEVAVALKGRGVDLIDCSSGGLAPSQHIPLGPGYQVPFAELVRREAAIPTAAVGLITDPHHAAEIVRSGRADLVAIGREFLRQPHFPLHAAHALGQDLPWPRQYRRAKPVL